MVIYSQVLQFRSSVWVPKKRFCTWSHSESRWWTTIRKPNSRVFQTGCRKNQQERPNSGKGFFPRSLTRHYSRPR